MHTQRTHWHTHVTQSINWKVSFWWIKAVVDTLSFDPLSIKNNMNSFDSSWYSLESRPDAALTSFNIDRYSSVNHPAIMTRRVLSWVFSFGFSGVLWLGLFNSITRYRLSASRCPSLANIYWIHRKHRLQVLLMVMVYIYTGNLGDFSGPFLVAGCPGPWASSWGWILSRTTVPHPPIYWTTLLSSEWWIWDICHCHCHWILMIW